MPGDGLGSASSSATFPLSRASLEGADEVPSVPVEGAVLSIERVGVEIEPGTLPWLCPTSAKSTACRSSSMSAFWLPIASGTGPSMMRGNGAMVGTLTSTHNCWRKSSARSGCTRFTLPNWCEIVWLPGTVYFLTSSNSGITPVAECEHPEGEWVLLPRGEGGDLGRNSEGVHDRIGGEGRGHEHGKNEQHWKRPQPP